MAGIILYPPVVDTYMPAFIANCADAKCNIYFSLSKYNSLNDIKSVWVSVNNQFTNETVLASPLGLKAISGTPQVDETREGDDKYYIALNKEDLASDKRNEFCDFWINGVQSILSNSSFSFNYAFLFVLFRQIDSNASIEIKNRLKRLILNIITYDSNNGLVSKLKDVAREFLKTNSSISNAVFNTIIMLAEDEMKHQKFNYSYIIETDEKCDIEFVPNHTPRLKGVDRVILQEGKTGYNKKTEEIVGELKELVKEKAQELANELELPIVIHSRDAVMDTIDMIKNKNIVNKKGIFHCCQLNPEFIKEAVKAGIIDEVGGIKDAFRKLNQMIKKANKDSGKN